MFFLVVLVLFYTFPVSSLPGTSLSKDQYVGCPDTSATRCGPRYNRFCSGSGNALYCDEAQGLCGDTAKFRDAQTSSKYDAASIPKSCLNICSSGLLNPSYSTLIHTGWKMENMGSQCQGNGTGWFGCPAPGNEVGSASFKFTGQGLATLRYRNCQKMGKIEVVYEGKTLSDTEKKKEVTVNFPFEDNGMLTLKTRGTKI